MSFIFLLNLCNKINIPYPHAYDDHTPHMIERKLRLRRLQTNRQPHTIRHYTPTNSAVKV